MPFQASLPSRKILGQLDKIAVETTFLAYFSCNLPDKAPIDCRFFGEFCRAALQFPCGI
jgi:hypothetical protein